MRAHPQTWLKLLPQGLYCAPGDFFIDPLRGVERAVITHAHSDHARPGHAHALCSAATGDLMAARMGNGAPASVQALAWGETQRIGDVAVSLHPAGHVLGSAQICLDYQDRKSVV